MDSRKATSKKDLTNWGDGRFLTGSIELSFFVALPRLGFAGSGECVYVCVWVGVALSVYQLPCCLDNGARLYQPCGGTLEFSSHYFAGWQSDQPVGSVADSGQPLTVAANRRCNH